MARDDDSATVSEVRQILALTCLEMSLYFRRIGGLLFALFMPTGLFLLATRLWYPPEMRHVAVPDMLVIVVFSSGLFSIGVAITQQRVDGTLKTYLSSPLRPRSYLIAQIADRVSVTLVGTLVLLLVAYAGYDVRLGGNFLVFLGCLLLCLATMIAFGFLLASRFTSVEVAGGSSGLIFFAVMVASGQAVDPGKLPGWLATTVDLLPFKPIVALMRISWSDASFTGGGTKLLLVAGWLIVFVALASRFFRWTSTDR
ncbi:ABC transporter permease [Austwickia chelonae]|uniref:ABC transporter permease n=1 Tax=Austwickia chelonae TaxID=100225 RepID=UPI000E22787B|nr:ABC transporter permease [Austwickia chelonae]